MDEITIHGLSLNDWRDVSKSCLAVILPGTVDHEAANWAYCLRKYALTSIKMLEASEKVKEK